MTRRRALVVRCGAVAIGLLADRVLPEPPSRFHPVAWFGSAMGAVERRVWRDDRRAGALYAAVGATIGYASGRLLRSTTAAVALCAAGQQLRRIATDIGATADAGDLAGARAELPALAGRDPSSLDECGIAAAVIESVAENSVDAMVAPAFWAVVAGAPGATVYRAVNTMDAMVGHRGDRYGRFGTAVARADDVANWIPARLFACCLAAATPRRAGAVSRTVRRDAAAHPSPNAGVAEAAMAGALGCELGGPLVYGIRREERPRLGNGERPTPSVVGTAVALADRVELMLVGALGVVAVVGRARQRCG